MKSKFVKIGLAFFLISIFQIPVLEKSYSEDETIFDVEFNSCTSDWNITGYFLPLESDYSGKLIEISVGEGNQSYVADFVDVIRIEGWGRTNAGNYLGWYGDSYHIADTSLDSQGGDLVVGTIAVDASLIEPGSKLTIPTLPEPWNSIIFSALDEGPSIIGKHIDVFTGEGINAEKETFRITSSDNSVCIETKPVFETEVKFEAAQASGICGEGTMLVDGVCEVTKASGTIIEPLYILIGAFAIVGGIVVTVFAVKIGTKPAKPVKRIRRIQRKKQVRRKPRKKQVRRKPRKKRSKK